MMYFNVDLHTEIYWIDINGADLAYSLSSIWFLLALRIAKFWLIHTTGATSDFFFKITVRKSKHYLEMSKVRVRLKMFR